MNKETDTGEELHEHHRFAVDPGQTPVRIDKFLMDRLEKASRSRVQKAIKAGTILVNDMPIKSNYKVRPNDIIVISMAKDCLLYTSPSPRDATLSRMPSSA